MYFIPSAIKKHNYPTSFGVIISPSKNNSGSVQARIRLGWKWIVDNGVFTGKFKEEIFFKFLEKMAEYKSQCVFAVAPDVIADAKKTLEQFLQYAPKIKALGYPVALVAQDGQEDLPFPENFDALFIGGSTEWKLGNGAAKCIKRAQELGKWVHVGRVNSRKRIHYFSLLKVNSVDGTYLAFSPDKHRKDLIKWMHEAKQPLFYM